VRAARRGRAGWRGTSLRPADLTGSAARRGVRHVGIGRPVGARKKVDSLLFSAGCQQNRDRAKARRQGRAEATTQHDCGVMLASLIRQLPPIFVRPQLPDQRLHPSESSVVMLWIVAVASSDECSVAPTETSTL
jgi:hypothetical protein